MIEYVADRLGHDRRYSLNFKKALKDLSELKILRYSNE